MKATIELDENRLKQLMRLTGLKTRQAVIEYALREAERAARMRRFLKHLLPDDAYVDALAPGYDVLTLREKETPYGA